MDAACKEHDIAYFKHQNIVERHKADKILAEKAWQRVISKDAKLSERSSAFLVTNIMNAKTKFGMGIRVKKLKKEKHTPSISSAIRYARKVLKMKKPKSIKDSIKIALNAAKKIINQKNNIIKTPRIIPVPKVGGVIPFLIPLFAGLSAIGALSGGVAGIAKAVNDATQAKKQLSESKRHNETMESIAIGKGLFLKPYKNGLGLYVTPYPKNY